MNLAWMIGPIAGLNDATLTWAGWANEAVKENTLALTGIFEGGILPVTRSLGLGLTCLFVLIALVKTFWSYATGESQSLATPIGTVFLRFMVVIVLLTNGMTGSQAGIGVQGPYAWQAGPTPPGQLAIGDNYTAVAWGIAGFADSIQKQMETGSLGALTAARRNWPVCVVSPPNSITSTPSQSQATGSATNSQTTNTNQVNCSTYNSNQPAATQQPQQQSKNWISSAIDGVRDTVDGGGQAAMVLFNGLLSNLAGGLILVVQMAIAPIVFVFAVAQQAIRLILWALGPLTLGLFVHDPEYFYNWIKQYTQVCFWPLVTELLISLVAFMRQGTLSDPTNPAAAWLGFAFSLVILFGLFWVPKICAWGTGLAASAGGAVGDAIAGTAAVAAAGATGGVSKMAGQYTGGKAVGEKADAIASGMRSEYMRNPQSQIKADYETAQSRGYQGDPWKYINDQAKTRALKDLQTERKATEMTGKPLNLGY